MFLRYDPIKRLGQNKVLCPHLDQHHFCQQTKNILFYRNFELFATWFLQCTLSKYLRFKSHCFAIFAWSIFYYCQNMEYGFIFICNFRCNHILSMWNGWSNPIGFQEQTLLLYQNLISSLIMPKGSRLAKPMKLSADLTDIVGKNDNYSDNYYECKTTAIVARTQSTRTYLEKHLDEFDCDLEPLVTHGLRTLRAYPIK